MILEEENPFTTWYLGTLKIHIKEEWKVKRPAKAQICRILQVLRSKSQILNHFFHVWICVLNSYMWASIKPARPYSIPSETKAGFNCIHTSESPHTDSCKVFEPYIQLWRESCLLCESFFSFLVSFIRKKNQEFHFTSFDALRTSFWLTLSLHGYQIYFVLTD